MFWHLETPAESARETFRCALRGFVWKETTEYEENEGCFKPSRNICRVAIGHPPVRWGGAAAPSSDSPLIRATEKRSMAPTLTAAVLSVRRNFRCAHCFLESCAPGGVFAAMRPPVGSGFFGGNFYGPRVGVLLSRAGLEGCHL